MASNPEEHMGVEQPAAAGSVISEDMQKEIGSALGKRKGPGVGRNTPRSAASGSNTAELKRTLESGTAGLMEQLNTSQTSMKEGIEKFYTETEKRHGEMKGLVSAQAGQVEGHFTENFAKLETVYHEMSNDFKDMAAVVTKGLDATNQVIATAVEQTKVLNEQLSTQKAQHEQTLKAVVESTQKIVESAVNDAVAKAVAATIAAMEKQIEAKVAERIAQLPAASNSHITDMNDRMDGIEKLSTRTSTLSLGSQGSVQEAGVSTQQAGVSVQGTVAVAQVLSKEDLDMGLKTKSIGEGSYSATYKPYGDRAKERTVQLVGGKLTSTMNETLNITEEQASVLIDKGVPLRQFDDGKIGLEPKGNLVDVVQHLPRSFVVAHKEGFNNGKEPEAVVGGKGFSATKFHSYPGKMLLSAKWEKSHLTPGQVTDEMKKAGVVVVGEKEGKPAHVKIKMGSDYSELNRLGALSDQHVLNVNDAISKVNARPTNYHDRPRTATFAG